MKIIIAGGRDYVSNPTHATQIIEILLANNCTEIVSGGARGADAFGENLATKIKIPLRLFPALWDLYGRSAGMIRNEAMAKYADGCILLPGGKGTQNMKLNAEKYGLKIWEIK